MVSLRVGMSEVTLCCVVFCVGFFVDINRKMGDYINVDDDDYGDLFITQSSSGGNAISLEENDGKRGFSDVVYSDISDDENDGAQGKGR